MKMFRLGVITDEISPDVEKSLNVAKELGMNYIELRQCWNKNIKDLTDAEINRIKRIAGSAGLEVVCIASPFFKCNITNEAEVKNHLHFLRRLIEIAKSFDTEIIRGFAFWSTGSPDQYWNRIIEKLREATDICKSEGEILALENEPATFIGTGKEAKNILKEVGSESLRLVWDPGNAFCAGEVPYPDEYLQARDHVAHMHLKDALRDRGTGKIKIVAVGSGEIDYEGQFKALIKDNYSGCLSIETHYRIQNDGEKSTRETYAGLKRILKKLKIE